MSNQNSLTQVTPAQLSVFLEYVCLKARKPVFAWGPPGLGKTAVIKQTAKRLDFKCLTVIAAQKDPTDISGIPFKVESDGITRTSWALPDWLPVGDEPTVIFWDELPNSVTTVQNAIQQAILEGQVGNWKQGANTVHIAAGNRIQDRAGAGKLQSALANRFTHCDVVDDLESWLKWSAQPDSEIYPLVRDFLRWRPTAFYNFDPSRRQNPTARTWEYLSDLCKQDIPKEIKLQAYCGTVGDGEGVEYAGFEKIAANIVPVETIFLNPKAAPIPTELSAQYAVAGAVSRYLTDQNIGRGLTYLGRMSKDFEVMAVVDGMTRDQGLMVTTDFNAWASDNREFVM